MFEFRFLTSDEMFAEIGLVIDIRGRTSRYDRICIICTRCRNTISLPMHFVPPAKGGCFEKGAKSKRQSLSVC
jgi:hypothetical protein